jgi:hypothetical protein
MLAQTDAQGTGSPIASEFSHRDTSISTSSSSMVARLLATAESVSASGRARPLASRTCQPICQGALIIQHPHRDARSNGSTKREPFLPRVPVLLCGVAPIIHTKVPCDARTAAHVELGFLSYADCAGDRHVRPGAFLPYVPPRRRNQSQRLAAANSVAAATSTHGADDAYI